MQPYEQAMESLRLSDPDFHKKLTDTLKQITRLPEETAQQLADSLDHITDPGTYREKLTSSLSNIHKAAEQSLEVFEKEESWIITQSRGVSKNIRTAALQIVDGVARALHELHLFMNRHSRLFSDLAMYNFLVICFCFAAYYIYVKDSSGRSISSRLSTKTFVIFLLSISPSIVILGANKDLLGLVFPVVALGALAGRLPSLIPPSRSWPGQAMRSDAVKTWLGAFGATLGFLLSSGFFAFVALMLQTRQRDTMTA